MKQPINANTPASSISLAAFGATPVSNSITKLVAGQQIQITPVIPYEKILEAMQWSIDLILDDRTFISAPLKTIISDFALIKFWSNVSIYDTTAAAAEDLYQNYDIVISHGVLAACREVISKEQQDFFFQTLFETLESIVAYRNSAAGIVESLTEKAKEGGEKGQDILSLLDDPKFSVIKGALSAIEKEQLAQIASETSED